MARPRIPTIIMVPPNYNEATTPNPNFQSWKAWNPTLPNPSSNVFDLNKNKNTLFITHPGITKSTTLDADILLNIRPTTSKPDAPVTSSDGGQNANPTTPSNLNPGPSKTSKPDIELYRKLIKGAVKGAEYANDVMDIADYISDLHASLDSLDTTTTATRTTTSSIVTSTSSSLVVPTTPSSTTNVTTNTSTRTTSTVDPTDTAGGRSSRDPGSGNAAARGGEMMFGVQTVWLGLLGWGVIWGRVWRRY